MKSQFKEEHSGVNREKLHKGQVELNRKLQREKELWKQKKIFEWLKNKERSTKFFHTIVKG